MKKKFLALAMAAVMMMGLSTTAFAATDTDYAYTDEVSVSVSKETTATNGTAPSETLNFTVTAGEFTPYNEDDTTTVTVPSISGFSIKTTDGEGSGTINLPVADDFAALGTYTYTIEETAGSEAGMSYDDSVYTMKISIVLDANGNKIRVVSIWNEDGEKVDESSSGESEFGFTNTYTANSLSVQKVVKGNQGVTNKEFSFTITFENENDAKTWTEAIGHADSQGDSSYNKTTDAENGTVTYTFTLSDQDTVVFTNIPSGISYNVSEETDGYTQTVSGGSLTGTTDGTDISLVVTNTLDNEVPTGVNLDSLPYVMILGLVLIGAAYVISRRRLTDR